MFPRLLSYYLQKHVSQKAFEKGEAIKMNSLTFTRLMAKESDVFKTEAEGNEEILDESTTAPQTSVAEPTALGDHSTTTTAVKPPPTKLKRPKQNPKSPPKPSKPVLWKMRSQRLTL